MLSGTITNFDAGRGYGFILCNESGQSVFFHRSNFARGKTFPVVGANVTFVLGPAIDASKPAQAIAVSYAPKPVQNAISA